MPHYSKPIVWLPRETSPPPFSPRARIRVGELLRSLQVGEAVPPPDSRPMPQVGWRCHELRVPDAWHMWRIVYALEPEAVVLLDIFSRATSTTSAVVVERCRWRLALSAAVME